VEGFPETVETQPELIAHHFAQAGLPERAIEYLRKAGRRAIEQSAYAESIRHLAGALESLQSLPESLERNRAALELEVMLSQAMIVDRGYAAPETRTTCYGRRRSSAIGTSNAAALLKLDDRGVLASGKLGDMVVLDGDPTADISNSRKIHAVWHRGKKAAGPVEMFTP
jgi:hypothetical protein